MHNSNILFTEKQLGQITVKNRIFMAPLTRCRADNPEAKPTAIHAKYYKQRSTAGLIISEGTAVSPRSVGYHNIPGIYTREQVEAWKKVTRAVHEEEGKIFCQLWHVGRISHPDYHEGELPLAPSAINPEREISTPTGRKKSVTPKAMTIAEIKQTVQDFVHAGINALEAGFDGIEIHSSNGYLFHQFFSNSSNHRQDEYGGTIENKARILFEVIEAFKEKIPEHKIGLRLNPMMHNANGITVDEETATTFDYIVNRLNDYQLAYLHVSRPWRKNTQSFYIQDVIGHYRNIYKGFYVANGNYDGESAARALEEGEADAVAFGRPFISNPDLPARIANNWPLAEPDSATYYTSGEKGYIDYLCYNPG